MYGAASLKWLGYITLPYTLLINLKEPKNSAAGVLLAAIDTNQDEVLWKCSAVTRKVIAK